MAPDPEFNRVCRAFAEHQRIAGTVEPRVVSTLEEAHALLGLANPQFEPVEEPSAG